VSTGDSPAGSGLRLTVLGYGSDGGVDCATLVVERVAGVDVGLMCILIDSVCSMGMSASVVLETIMDHTSGCRKCLGFGSSLAYCWLRS